MALLTISLTDKQEPMFLWLVEKKYFYNLLEQLYGECVATNNEMFPPVFLLNLRDKANDDTVLRTNQLCSSNRKYCYRQLTTSVGPFRFRCKLNLRSCSDPILKAGSMMIMKLLDHCTLCTRDFDWRTIFIELAFLIWAQVYSLSFHFTSGSCEFLKNN